MFQARLAGFKQEWYPLFFMALNIHTGIIIFETKSEQSRQNLGRSIQ
jgi:hypothetical protein